MVGHDAIVDRATSDGDRWLYQWKRAWAQVAAGAGLATGLFLLLRRFDGGLSNPLGAGSLLVVAVALIASAACIRRFWSVDDGSSIGRRVLPALMLAAVGLAVSLPLTNGFALLAFWVSLILSEVFSFWTDTLRNDSLENDTLGNDTIRSDGRQTVENEEHTSSPDPVETPSETFAPIQSPTPALGEPLVDSSSGNISLEPESPEVDGQVIQKLLRTRDPSGQEVMFGELRAEFAKGDRQSRLHVAFCPPLERPPEVFAEATIIDEQLGDVTVKVAQVLALGTRIDVELSAPATAAGCVQVEFYAAIES